MIWMGGMLVGIGSWGWGVYGLVSWGGEVAVYIGLRLMVGKVWSVSYITVRYKQL